MEVRLADSTPRSGEPAPWGSGTHRPRGTGRAGAWPSRGASAALGKLQGSFSSIKEQAAGPQARKPGNPRRSCRPTARVDLEDLRKSVETADLGAFHTAGAHLCAPALVCPSPRKALIRVSVSRHAGRRPPRGRPLSASRAAGAGERLPKPRGRSAYHGHGGRGRAARACRPWSACRTRARAPSLATS